MILKKIETDFIDLNLILNKDVTDVMNFLKYRGAKKVDDEEEVISLKKFSLNISESNRIGFIVSYNINFLDKEFDLLKLDKNTIINIELKKSHRDDTERFEQVCSNYMILKSYYSGRNIFVFSYVSDDNSLYIYDYEKNQIRVCPFDLLNKLLDSFENNEMISMEHEIINLYQDPEFFLEKNYFLSRAQDTVKRKILEDSNSIIIINGFAGSGKSLCAMDLYDTFLNKKSKTSIYLLPVLVSRVVNPKLTIKYNIKMVKYFLLNDNSYYEYIIVDESQRLSKSQLNLIKQKCNKMILFTDINQNIDDIFEENSIQSFIEENKNIVSQYQLSQSIRSDGTFVKFANKVLKLNDKNIKKTIFDSKKISIYMKSDIIKENIDDFFCITPTPSKYSPCSINCNFKKCLEFERKLKRNYENERIVHYVIGNEYDNVMLYLCDGIRVVDEKIYATKKITYGNLIYQLNTIITRTRKKLIIVCEDISVYNYLKKCIEELS